MFLIAFYQIKDFKTTNKVFAKVIILCTHKSQFDYCLPLAKKEQEQITSLLYIVNHKD